MAEVNPTEGNTIISGPAPGSATAGKSKSVSRMKLRGTVVSDAAGIATLSFQVPTGYDWFIERGRIRSTSVMVSRCEIFDGIVDNTHSDDFTLNGNDDIMDNFQPAWFGNGTQLIVYWTGTTPGCQCYASLQVRSEG